MLCKWSRGEPHLRSRSAHLFLPATTELRHGPTVRTGIGSNYREVLGCDSGLALTSGMASSSGRPQASTDRILATQTSETFDRKHSGPIHLPVAMEMLATLKEPLFDSSFNA